MSEQPVDRRGLITRVMKMGGAVLGAGALGGCSSKDAPASASSLLDARYGRDAGQWIASCCNMCGGQTGIMVHVVEGRVVKIEPNNHNPIGFAVTSEDFFENAQREGAVVCPKGNAGIMTLYDPDRVRKPLKRTNPEKGIGVDPKWMEISWDQALDEIAAKLRALRQAGEAHKLLWFSEDHSFVHVQDDFCTLYGTPNRLLHSNLCDVARKASFKMAMGDERPLPDMRAAKYILLFGWNPTSAIKWTWLPRAITQGIERGARLVVVDPYLSDTACKAHEHVAIRPGTDGALALAMCHVIVRDGLWDKEFVRDWTVGFEEFCEFIRDKTPSWAEKETSVPAATIERIARQLATTKPAAVDFWSGVGQHSNGVQSGRAIALLAALVGGYDRPGTLLIPERNGNKHNAVEPDEHARMTLAQPRFDRLHEYPFGHKSGVYTEVMTRLARGDGPYQPKAAVVIFQNLAMSIPGTQTVIEALKKLELLVVVDTFRSETAEMADYLLPGTTYLERYDLTTNWVSFSSVSLRQPVVAPLFGQLAEYEFVAALGRRLDLRDANGKEFFWIGPLSGNRIENLTRWYEDYLSAELKNGGPGITLDELKRLPGAVWNDPKGTRYEKFKEVIPPERMATAVIEGTAIYDKPKAKGGKRIGTLIDGVPRRGFMTPSGKVEFYSPWMADKKDADGRAVDPLPVYRPRDWQPTPDYPLYLINWKEAAHTHTRTQNNQWLLDLQPVAPLIIHPDTAAKLGIRDGDPVWVESPYGRVRATALLTRRMHREVVGMQHGFGHWALGRFAQGRGSHMGFLNISKAEALSGMAQHKEVCVRVYRA